MSAGANVVQIESYPKPPLAVIWDGSGNTISRAIDTEGFNLTGLLIPDAWGGGGTITFLVAEKGDPEMAWPPAPSEQAVPRYRPLVDAAGAAVQVTGIVAGKFVSLSALTALKGARYIKMVAASAPAANTTIWATRVQYPQ